MQQAKKSPLCIHVTYKLETFSIRASPEGVTVGDLIRLTCGRLGIPAVQHTKHAILRNKILLQRTQVLYPFERVVMCESKRPADPPLKASLWQITRMTEGKDNKDILRMLAMEVVQEMIQEMQVQAHYKQSEMTFVFATSDCGHIITTPFTWQRILLGDPNIREESDKVLEYVRDEFRKHGMEPTVEGNRWTLSWKPNDEEEFLVRVTARDLNAMGYPINDKKLYMDIHQQLRQAIVLGEVSDQSLDAQKAWVRRTF